MILKAFEISCDYCGTRVPDYCDTKKQAESWYKEQGGIVRDKRHFCDKECYDNLKNALKLYFLGFLSLTNKIKFNNRQI